MTGRKAVPRGATHGRGAVTIRISGRRVCWTFGRLHRVGKPRAAFIKHGIPGEFGPVVVKLGRRYSASGCATTTLGTAQQLALSPRGFYVTVNTRRFPLGAVRGQLRKGVDRRTHGDRTGRPAQRRRPGGGPIPVNGRARLDAPGGRRRLR